MSSDSEYPQIPGAGVDFEAMRRGGMLYVDKTRFVRHLEHERYTFLNRPRGFGKSCWLSMLEYYYDRAYADRFETLFAGTDIGREPTPERNRYVVLRFDFAQFAGDREWQDDRFDAYCRLRILTALERNRDLFSQEVIDDVKDAGFLLGVFTELFLYARRRDIALYVLVDEYDNFADPFVAAPRERRSRSITPASSRYQQFFTILKVGTGEGAVERILATGVLPILMPDGGYNIATNISLQPAYNEVAGFTEAEVRGILELYRDRGAFAQNVDEALGVMGEWYRGYGFAREAPNDLFHAGMVLHYLRASIPNRPPPADLIDPNVRAEHGKVRNLLGAGGPSNDDFDVLREIVEEGWDTSIDRGFFPDEVHSRDHYLSLLHYLGVLSIRGGRRRDHHLAIPNATVRRMIDDYLGAAPRDGNSNSNSDSNVEG